MTTTELLQELLAVAKGIRADLAEIRRSTQMSAGEATEHFIGVQPSQPWPRAKMQGEDNPSACGLSRSDFAELCQDVKDIHLELVEIRRGGSR